MTADEVVQLAYHIADHLTGHAQAVAKVMLESGCRISEALQITSQDIDQYGFTVIRAKKRGRDRIANCPSILPYRCIDNNLRDKPVFQHFSYWRFYRAIKNLCGAQLPSAHLHKKVSNLFRSAAACRSQLAEPNRQDLAAGYLGHRSKTSTDFYLNNRRVTNG